MPEIKEEDRAIVKQFRDDGILRDVETHRLDHSRGVILVCCADGDQLPDIFAHHSGICEAQESRPRIHTLSLNGGSLLIPEGSPLNKERREDLTYLHHIEVATVLKHIHTVALYAHIPCGAAGMYRLGAQDVVDMLMRAKLRIKQQIAEAKVGCFLHVDKGAGNKRTYFVSRHDWSRLRELPEQGPYRTVAA